MALSYPRSEVAQLMWSIQKSCEAIHRVMVDPGFSATHQEINQRYHALGQLEDQLATYIGTEKATDTMYNIYNHVMNQPGTSDIRTPQQSS